MSLKLEHCLIITKIIYIKYCNMPDALSKDLWQWLIHYTVPICKTDIYQIMDDVRHVISMMSDLHVNLTAMIVTGVWYKRFVARNIILILCVLPVLSILIFFPRNCCLQWPACMVQDHSSHLLDGNCDLLAHCNRPSLFLLLIQMFQQCWNDWILGFQSGYAVFIYLFILFISLHPYKSGTLDMEHVNKKRTYYRQYTL